MLAAAHGPSAFWYASRGAGAVALVLLTVSVALGIAEARMWRPARTPGFAIAAIHRTASLLAVVLIAIHVVTVSLDPFPPIGIVNGIVPFVTGYRTLWLALGTIAFDLLLAVAITSLLRTRLGYRAWRGVHWAAYASWPIALLHGLGAGSDAKTTWMLAIDAACVAAVLAAVAARLAAPGVPPAARTLATAGTAAALLGMAIWAIQGPLASGWARRAGTPESVLAAFSPHAAVKAAKAAPRPAPAPLARPFSASLTGRARNGISSDGTGVVDLALRLQGGPPGRLRVRLGGRALPEGGLQMDRSAVSLGPPSDPARYQGRIESLQGSQLRALVGGADGHAIRLVVDLELGSDTVSGQVRGAPVDEASR
jgi:methionine sulfoxide reductase heme-binding subunit